VGAKPVCSTVFCERQATARSSALLPLQADGLAEVLSVLASAINLYSAVMMLATSDSVRIWSVLPADLLSAILWLVDSLCYCRAWQTSLPDLSVGVRRWWRPASAWYWANVLNVVASLAFVVVAVVAMSVVAAGGEGGKIVIEQRSTFVIGDVMYLLCALVCQSAWQLDRKALAAASSDNDAAALRRADGDEKGHCGDARHSCVHSESTEDASAVVPSRGAVMIR
jgi:hypothetical protein